MGWTWIPRALKCEKTNDDIASGWVDPKTITPIRKPETKCNSEIESLKLKVERLERIINSILVVEDSNQVRYSSNLESVKECQNILSGATPRAYTQVKASIIKEQTFIKYDSLKTEMRNIENDYPEFKKW